MKKLTLKSLALVLTLTLVLSTCLFGSAMFVSAVVDDENATVTQTVYNNYDVNTQEEVLDKIGDLSNSLLSGKIPHYYTTAWTNGSANTNFALLTDNTIGTFFNVNFYNPYSYEYKGNTYSGSASRMYYELESAHEITSVILVDASHQATAGQGSAGIGNNNLTLPSFKVYLSETAKEHQLFDVDALNTSYSITANTITPGDSKAIVYNITFNEPVAARYIGFEFPESSCAKGSNPVVIYEVAAFGTEIVPDVKITTAAGTTSDTYDTSKNLIYGKMSTTYPTAFAGFTDGLNAKVPVGGSGSNWPLRFTYQLDSIYKIDKVRVTTDASNYGAGKLRLGEYAIYVSDNADDLYNDENLIAHVVGETSNFGANQTVIDTIEFLETYDTTGSYIGFAIITATLNTASYGSAYVYELEVEGTENIPDWTVSTATGSTSDPINTDNLIYGKLTEEFGSNVLDLTDGVNKQRGLSSATTLTFDMGGYAKVDGVRVISQNQTEVASSRLGAYEIYVADSVEELYNAENKIAEINPEATTKGWRTYVDTFAFADHYAKTGKYIGFKILARNIATGNAEGSMAYINEIEVTGTRCPTVTATAGNGGTITPAGDTLLNGTAVEYTVTADEGYKVAEVLVNGVAAELTDGKYTFAGTETGWNTISASFSLIGDANNDTVLDGNDLIVIKKHLLDIEKVDLKYVDVDSNGKVDIRDLIIAYDLQQGLSPAVAALKATLGITDGQYISAINRAKAYNTSATDTQRLNAVFEKAANGEPITIAAIGGSITEGAGSNVMSGVSVSAEDLGVTVNGKTYENSKYVDRVVNWFDAKFENSTVTKVNAGISGTPSFFGTFRLENDVLSKNPDLVIVEFSVNDLGNYDLEEGYMLDAYESVVRKCLENGSAVITVFTINNLSNNKGNSWQTYHKAIADHYNIPTISYHNAVYPNGEWITEWEKLSGDKVHPNVAGHALLANCITSYLDDVYAMDSHSSTAIPADWYHNDTFADTDIIYMGDVQFDGMAKTASNKYGYIATNKTGTGNESIVAQIPAGAKEIYVFYNTIDNAGSIYTTLGDNTESGPYSTNVSSISYSHGEWTKVYKGEALSEDTNLTIRSADDGKPLEILTILVVK